MDQGFLPPDHHLLPALIGLHMYLLHALQAHKSNKIGESVHIKTRPTSPHLPDFPH
ncbi:amidohydrolase family protein [Sesbania bispinosa]|nr:amidohydrolase family protein [Sesbania bispinosa]